MAGLTDKQRAFVEAYADCLNATEAARRAGYAEPRRQGSRLLSYVDIRAAVDEALAAQAMPKTEVVARLASQARADIRDLFTFQEADETDEAGNVVVPAGAVTGLNLHRSAPLHLIKSITPTRYGNKVELHDQQAALVKLGETFGIFRQSIDLVEKELDAALDKLRDGLPPEVYAQVLAALARGEG